MVNHRIQKHGARYSGFRAADRTVANVSPGVSIICAADDNYALPLAVMLESLLANLDPKTCTDVHIVDAGLTSTSREGIDAIARGRARFHWLRAAHDAGLGAPRWGHVTRVTYERLRLDDYLPADTRHALWLDADLLVLDDVTPFLLLKDHGDGVLSAVRDPFVPRVSSPFGISDWRALGLAREMPYFNAGVMLIDMKKWRKLSIARRSFEYLRRHGRSVHFNEQEALNAVVGSAWTPLDDRWNMSANRFHAPRQAPGGAGGAIVHFSGRVKPWAIPELGAIQDVFFQHLDNTPWRHARPRRTARTRLLSWYLNSRVRHATYWLENQHLKWRHFRGY